MTYSFKAARLAALVPLVFLGACQNDATAPTRGLSAPSASQLVAPGENLAVLLDTTDANGTTTMVIEYAAGTTQTASDVPIPSIGSVTIKTVIPGSAAAGSSSKSCITSTIVATDVTPGWTSSVKKAGGCDKEIAVQFENKTLKKRADFSFLFVAGKTRIDFGAVK